MCLPVSALQSVGQGFSTRAQLTFDAKKQWTRKSVQPRLCRPGEEDAIGHELPAPALAELFLEGDKVLRHHLFKDAVRFRSVTRFKLGPF